MIQLIDVVEFDGVEKSIVKGEALKRAVLVQDAGRKDDLFALLMVDDQRAVLVTQGKLSFNTTGAGMLRLQTFRVQLDKTNIRTKELRFCAAGSYDAQVAGARVFDPQCFVEPSFPDLVERFTGWRSGRASW